MSTADSVESWLNKRTAELRKRIDGVRASDALEEASEAADGATVAHKPLQDATTALQAEDDIVLRALRRINRKERRDRR